MNIHDGFLVTEAINGAHRNEKLKGYNLLPGDLVTEQEDGSFLKQCPGITIGGFLLTEAQIETLKPTRFARNGLSYAIVGEPSHA